jgi:diacylglycerol O-acyltransferase / wax synthase
VTAHARPTRMISACAGLPGFGSPRRRATLLRLDADLLRRIGKQHAATLNEVILSVVTGGLRHWLVDDGELHPGETGATVRVLVPVSLRRYHRNPLAPGNHLSGYLVELPVGEPDPLRRLHRVRDTMARHKAAGPFRGPGAFPLLADWFPAAVHRLATRPIAQAAPLLFDTTVTTVPLPDIPLHIDGAALHEIYPLVPIAPTTASASPSPPSAAGCTSGCSPTPACKTASGSPPRSPLPPPSCVRPTQPQPRPRAPTPQATPTEDSP